MILFLCLEWNGMAWNRIELSHRFLACPLQDIARLTFIAMRNENLNGKLLTFAGPRAWTTQEVGRQMEDKNKTHTQRSQI